MTNRLLLLVPASALLLSGCNTNLLQSRVSEGTIEYALSFPGYDPNGLMSGMLPEKTILTFTEDKQAAEVSAGMGLFRTLMLADNEAKHMDYHMSMMGKRLVSHLKPRDLELFNGDYGKATILYTGDIDTIAGYPCQKALAIFNHIGQREIELWYTDRIAMNNPNWFNPFTEVPGVLLRYEVVQNGIRMKLDAVSVTPGKVDESKFTPKADYQAVSADVLHYELGEVMGTFSM
ncbi:MAG: hypothetical protein WAT74_04115 [Flavobacteriales bacterium]